MNNYWKMRGWKEVIIRADDEKELTLEDDDDEDLFDNLDEVVETIDDLFDILEDLLNQRDDIYIGTIPIIGDKKKDTKEETNTDDYDRAMKGIK